MLFGNMNFIEDLHKERHEIEQKLGMETIFGSTIGSISQGLSRYNSDYDVRFLFLKRDLVITNSVLHNEQTIRYRLFKENNSPYDCIAFWEYNAFINFLCEPYIDNDISYKLVRNVIWSFLSPYAWDPYGIQVKVIKLLDRIINLDYEISFYVNYLNDNISHLENIRQCLYLGHAAMSILWIEHEGTLPPIGIDVMLRHFDNRLSCNLKKIYSIYQKNMLEDAHTIEEGDDADIASLYKNIQQDLLQIIKRNKKHFPLVLNLQKKDFTNNRIICNQIRDIVFDAVHNRLEVKGVTIV